MLRENINFLITNRVPRIFLTQLVGKISKIKNPYIVKFCIRVWSWFSCLDFTESEKQEFNSIQECFTRKLRPETRPIDRNPNIVVSPCDAILGETGIIRGGQLFQAKDLWYELAELLGNNKTLALQLEGYLYMTMRLTSSMYHRFHAPCDCTLTHVTYINGDTWNVNPITLQRIQRLFCRNERAILHFDSDYGKFYMIPVAAILVAGIKLHAIDTVMDTKYAGPKEYSLNSVYKKGEELGWFQHGSTIIFLFPVGLTLAAKNQDILKFGQVLLTV